MPGAESPHPLAALLPGLFKEDPFSLGLCAGLDDVLGPVPVTLDCLDAYFDPWLTPGDFLEWLASWVGLSLDQNWSDAQRRELVARSAELYRWQGTARGIVEQVRLYVGAEPEVRESGAVAWSAQPDGALPGSAVAHLEVTVRAPSDTDVDQARVEAIVAAAKPAHVPHTVTVVRQG